MFHEGQDEQWGSVGKQKQQLGLDLGTGVDMYRESYWGGRCGSGP